MRVAIFTNFMDFNPGYSLTGIVEDQAVMLTRAGHEVDVFVNEQFGGERVPRNGTLRKLVPFAHLHDYRDARSITTEHRLDTVEAVKKMVAQVNEEVDIIFTHDWVFTGWNLPYAIALQEIGRSYPNLRWLHWIHSVPSQLFNWWNINAYGPNHRLVFPNKSHRRMVAEQFRGLEHQVEVIPHIKDMRSFFDFKPETWAFTTDYPQIQQSDVVQVYPASVDRLGAKRVAEVMLIFSRLKAQGLSVFLVIANQWATGGQQKEDVDRYKKIGRRNGLVYGDDFLFTSDWQTPKYDVGLPREILRELMMYSNLFIFPTQEESFGLVVPELSLSSGALLVLNKSLQCQIEISGMQALYFDFGSHERQFSCPDMDRYLNDIATIIYHRLQRNESLMTRTFMRQQYNMDNIYTKYYHPILIGAGKVW